MASKISPFSRDLLKVLKVIFISILLLFVLIVAMNIYIHPGHSQGHYSYTVLIQGLSSYKGGLVNDIIVPIPMIEGEQVFSDVRFQNRSFGNWTPLLVMTENGKMLAFQTIGENLTDIEAVFHTGLPQSITKEELSEAFRSPLMIDDAGEEESGGNRTTYVILPEYLRPISGNATPISIQLNFSAHQYFSYSPKVDYRALASRKVPPGTTGIVPLKILTGSRSYPEETFGPLE